MQYTEEQITRANQTNLVSFLNAQGEQLVKSGREYRWKRHDSVTVSGNRWYRHSQGRGGYPVDFVMEFYNATFPEAVKKLIGEEGEGRNSTCPAPSPDFRLPEKEENNDRIIRYLTENRGIEKNLVEEWSSSGDIYEEKKHHNVVFVGRDADGIPRYAHCRGTGEIKYRGDVAGSDKSCGFCHRGTDNQLFVFEAAIDLLSFIQLFPKDWKKRSYLSLGGISSAALMDFLSERPQITSLAPPGETMAFKLGDEEGFRWVGAYEISADDLLDGKEGKPTETKLQRGTKLIYELLADGNTITIREVDEKAKAQGISQRTMREVRSRMKEELDYQMNEKQENTIRLKG